jgi:putative Mg2+ transporter-C (MgtC) family protein
MMARVGLATALGVAIGAERQWRSRMAGLQTMALVSMGSALFLVLSAYSFEEEDRLRVAAQIVTGIGFLGAGVIMKQGLSVTGLNTAATLWSTAAVGALAGAWMWREAIAGTVIIVAVNGFLQPLGGAMDRKTLSGRETPAADYVFELIGKAEVESALRSLIVQTVPQPGIVLRSLQSFPTKSPDEIGLRAELSAVKRDDQALQQAVATFSVDPRVVSVRWTMAHEGAVPN